MKFNESLAMNKNLRERIDTLRRERVVFDSIYKKLERELHEKKKVRMGWGADDGEGNSCGDYFLGLMDTKNTNSRSQEGTSARSPRLLKSSFLVRRS